MPATSAAVDGWALGLVAVVLAALVAAAFALGRLQQQRRDTDALREARARQHLLDQVLDVWQWQTDRNHRLARLQPPAGAALAAWAAPSGGQPLWERVEGGSDAHAGLRAQLESMVPLRDVAVRAPDGSDAAHWLLRGVPRFDAQGRFEGYVGIARAGAAAAAADATSTRAGAPALQLESGEALSEQAAFSYTVTHDLRAPIRVVEGFARILKEDYGRVLDRVGNDHLDRVLAAAARMNGMIDALLALANLSAQPLTRQPVNLSQLAGYVVDDLRRGAPQRQVAVEIAPDLVVDGDPTLLRLVLENLLGNAWKYSARTPQARISLGAAMQDGRRVFTVADNGAGFDMRNADRLFGVFQRLHSANDFPGTGVGLASVKRIVRRHGGDIWAEAEPGRGASFHFTLGG